MVCSLFTQIAQIDPLETLDDENILWAPKWSNLHHILERLIKWEEFRRMKEELDIYTF